MIDTYLGNPKIKRGGVKQTYTKHEIDEYIKCMNDVCYFAQNYIKIISVDDGLVPFKLYDYQERYLKHLVDNRFSITLACRQSGKCQNINTKVNIKNKNTGEIRTVTVGELYEMSQSRTAKDIQRSEI